MTFLNPKNQRLLKKGETLLEVLLALTILTIASLASTNMIVTSLQANTFNKDTLIALNLAQEGVEYMRNLRDTNWLRFSADTQHCWLVKPSASTCSPANLLQPAPTNYGYALGDQLSTVVYNPGADLTDGVGQDSFFQLKYFDLDPTINSDNIGNKTDDKDYIGSFYTGAGVTESGSTKYYRSIQLEFRAYSPLPMPPSLSPWPTVAALPPVADIMIVRSIVQWHEATITHTITLSTSLSRYR